MGFARRMLRPLVMVAALVPAAWSAAETVPDVIRYLPPIDATAERTAVPTVPWGEEPPRGLTDEPLWRLAADSREYRVPEDVLPGEVPRLAEHKRGFFQKLSFTGTEILPDGSDGLGIFEAELLASFGLPCPTPEMPLILTPSLETQFLQGPVYVDLPPRVYAAKLDVMWIPKIGERFRGILGVTPGWYTDGQVPTEDAFRITGRVLGRVDLDGERLQLVGGAIYLNRLHSTWIPAAGLIWKPTDDWSLDLIFPRLKIARRARWGKGFETWGYLAGGFGGDNWIIEGPDGANQRLAYKDWRVTVGWERKGDGGAGLAAEAGYVFARRLEIDATAGEAVYEPGSTLLFRGVIAF